MTTILPFPVSDLEYLTELAPPDWGDITPAFRQYVQNDFCHPVKVAFDARLIGVGAAIHHGRTGWLAHIIVHPEFRSQGIGKRIIDFLLDHLKKSGTETVMLCATEAGEPLYRKCGFIPEVQYGFFKRDQTEVASGISRDIIDYTEGFRDYVLSLDKQISGEDRSAWLIPYLHEAKVHMHQNEIRGYYIPSLGDGLIGALDQDAGCALMQFRFQQRQNAIVPVDNRYAIDLLHNSGFSVYRQARRMWLGKPHSWKPECIYNRISGALG